LPQQSKIPDMADSPINVQEEAAKLRDKLNESNEKPE